MYYGTIQKIFSLCDHIECYSLESATKTAEKLGIKKFPEYITICDIKSKSNGYGCYYHKLKTIFIKWYCYDEKTKEWKQEGFNKNYGEEIKNVLQDEIIKEEE